MARRLFSILFLSITMLACKYTRHVPDNQLLLWDYKIEIEDGGKVNFEAENVIKQKPNDYLIFKSLRPGLSIHSWGSGNDSSLFSRYGRKPIIFDENAVKPSARQLENYYFNTGYFQVKVKTEILSRPEKKKAEVVYRVKRGPHYKIDSLSYSISPSLEDLVLRNQKESLLAIGQYYNSSRLDQERSRLAEIFQNNGYYNFTESYISFEADTIHVKESGLLALRLLIKGIPQRKGDSIIYAKPQRYFYRNVSIIPDFDFNQNTAKSDSSRYREYQLRFDTLQYKGRYLSDAIHFKSGDLYQKSAVLESYNHFSSYNAFDVKEISFLPFQGEDGKMYLDAQVRLVPRDKRTFTASTEATNTSGNYGVLGSVGIINRNLFGGGEALSFNINSGLEYQPSLSNSEVLSRTFEIGVELKLELPRLMLPFNAEGLIPKRMLPRSSFNIYANRTARVEFDRETFGGRLNYDWQENPQKTHRISLLNVSFSNLFSIDNSFISQLDPIQVLAFNSEFISSSSWIYTFSGQKSLRQKSYNFFTSNFEAAGNVQSLITNGLGEVNDDDFSSLFDVPVYQFARLEIDFRQYYRQSKEHLWIARINAGYILPYGLSDFSSDGNEIRIPPFSRFFFLGGTNDLRAWPAYRAGGGIEQISSYGSASSTSDNNFAIGTFKLLSNIEYRFPIYSSLKGAVFLDAGNIWLSGGLESNESAFNLQNLARDLYLGSGFGLRLDLDFFVIRFDTGVKVRDPGYWAQQEEWVIFSKPVLPNLTYNIALGYPF
jgi:outer membrane translocation and assembly module TamA